MRIPVVCALLLVFVISIAVNIEGASRPRHQVYAGFIRIQGNEPFTTPLFVTAYGSFVIQGPLRAELSSSRYQQRKIRVRGTVQTYLSQEIPNLPVLVVHEIVEDIGATSGQR